MEDRALRIPERRIPERNFRKAGTHALWSLAVLLLAAVAAEARGAPSVSWIEAPEDLLYAVNEGHVWVKWAPEGEADAYLLEETPPGADEPVRRRITDTSSFLTGMPQGVTELRVRAIRDGVEGPWSKTARVEVTYPSMGMVRVLAVLGTVLFIATAVLILAGHRRFSAEGLGASGGEEAAHG